ncbi:MAG: GGDEF domain-containing protein [Motiliproteus sp.]
MPDRLQPLFFLFLPLLAFACLYYFLPQLPFFSSPWEEVLPSLPYVLGALIAILGWHFNSGRSLLAGSLVLITYIGIQQSAGSDSLLYQLSLLVLIPANLAVIAWYHERGLVSPVALLRLAVIGLQLLAIILLIEHQPQQLRQWLYLQPQYLPALPLPLMVMASLALSFTALLVRLMIHTERFNAYLLLSAIICCTLIVQPLSSRELSLIISLALALWLFGLFRHSHSLAYLDDLTGLPGRRALNEHLMRLGRQHCLAMLDVDHFKKFNDTYGHDIGDQVLKLVAAKLGKVRMGKAYRYGGEEFCVVFSGRSLQQTLEPLEEIRQAIEDARLHLRSDQRPKDNEQGKKQRGTNNKPVQGQSVSVTISIGVAEQQAKANTLKAADKALYKAKDSGRNKVCH